MITDDAFRKPNFYIWKILLKKFRFHNFRNSLSRGKLCPRRERERGEKEKVKERIIEWEIVREREKK